MAIEATNTSKASPRAGQPREVGHAKYQTMPRLCLWCPTYPTYSRGEYRGRDSGRVSVARTQRACARVAPARSFETSRPGVGQGNCWPSS